MEQRNLQITDRILMVRPAHFGFNEETAANNAFQHNDGSRTPAEIQQAALAEFDAFAAQLRAHGIEVLVVDDSDSPRKPDAVFPNNWFSTHADGRLVTYPMYAPLRRSERREDIIAQLGERFHIGERLRLEGHEAQNLFLEGTGSMIIDHEHQIVYACTGPRTNPRLLDSFCASMEYSKIAFKAVDGRGKDIYHTNVMMALGETFVVICLEAVPSEADQFRLIKAFGETEKEVVEITLDQMNAFAGNMLQVRNADYETFLVMSEQAYRSLSEEQIRTLKHHTNILYAPLYTIEQYGGGSARCMMAEIFLPEKS